MATPAAANAGPFDSEGPRFANMTDTVTIKVETTESFTVHTSLLLRESNFFKQQEQLLLESKSFDLPSPHKTTTFEVFVKYLYLSRIPHFTWNIGDSIKAYKLGMYLQAERFAKLCEEHIRSQLFLKSPQPRLSHLCMLADLPHDPVKTLILQRISRLIIEGIYEPSEDASAMVDDLGAVAQPMWKDLLASIILQARRRSRDQPTAYGHSSRGPGFIAATGGAGQSSVGQGLFSNLNASSTSSDLHRRGNELFDNQQQMSSPWSSNVTDAQSKGNTGGGLFCNANQANPSRDIFGRPLTSASINTSTSAGTTGGLFGSQQPKHTPGGSLFGDAQTSNNFGGGLFSNANRQASTGGSLFGHNTTNQSSGGIFGCNNTHGATSTGGLSRQARPSSGWTFGCPGGVGAFGTITPFRGHEEREGNGATVVYQSIAALPNYHHTSHEELRLQDYQAGRRIGEGEKATNGPQTGIFATQGSVNSVPAETRSTDANREAELAAKMGELERNIQSLEESTAKAFATLNTTSAHISGMPTSEVIEKPASDSGPSTDA